MSNLEKIQKVMKVFQILTKVVMVFAFVGGALALIGGSIVLMAGSFPFAEVLQRLLVASGSMADSHQVGILLICESVVLILGAVEAVFVYRYFTLELREGTPFTETGAKKLTQLGIIFIVVEILTAAFSSAMEKFSFIAEHLDNTGSITLGICLILLAMVVRYGAELEKQNRV